jgi:hypothetical protein
MEPSCIFDKPLGMINICVETKITVIDYINNGRRELKLISWEFE